SVKDGAADLQQGRRTETCSKWRTTCSSLLLVVPEYCIHGLFCLMFMCAAEWVTLGLNIPLLFYHLWRYFHRPADGSEVMYDPVSIMNADILNYCQKESWCKLGFYLLSFFYYLYSMVYTLPSESIAEQEAEKKREVRVSLLFSVTHQSVRGHGRAYRHPPGCRTGRVSKGQNDQGTSFGKRAKDATRTCGTLPSRKTLPLGRRTERGHEDPQQAGRERERLRERNAEGDEGEPPRSTGAREKADNLGPERENGSEQLASTHICVATPTGPRRRQMAPTAGAGCQHRRLWKLSCSKILTRRGTRSERAQRWDRATRAESRDSN
ncbi:hypothetical protein Z043_120365, partial [Scleropages formosus]